MSTDWLCHHTAEWHLYHHSAAQYHPEAATCRDKKHCPPACVTLFLCLHIYIPVCQVASKWFCSSLLIQTRFFNHSWVFSLPLFLLIFLLLGCHPFWLSPLLISACPLIFLLICPLFASCLCNHSSEREACLPLKQYDMSSEKTVSMSHTSAWIHMMGIRFRKGLWKGCLCICVLLLDQIWRH